MTDGETMNGMTGRRVSESDKVRADTLSLLCLFCYIVSRGEESRKRAQALSRQYFWGTFTPLRFRPTNSAHFRSAQWIVG